MENLTDKEKMLLKYLFQICETMVSSNAGILLYDEDYDSFMYSDLWNLATKLGIEL